MASEMSEHMILPPSPMSEEEEEATKRAYQGYEEVIKRLPQAPGWGAMPMHLYKGYWLHSGFGLEGVMWSEEHLKPRPSDTLLVTNPKCGTTWLKALAFSVLNRSRFDRHNNNHPLLTTNPHRLVPMLEINLCRAPPITDPESLPSPRLLATHAPLSLLPTSLLSSGCRIVYICRDPKDMFVSRYHFALDSAPFPLEEAFEAFCEGVSPYGPFWDHVLEFWKVATTDPDKVLFLRYEDLKSDPVRHTKELAKFLGKPFSQEEDERGEVREIVELCSFQKMSNLEVNKSGLNSTFYRRGEIGDWKNHLTVEMKNRLQNICQQKFAPFGLKLGYD